MNNLPLDPSQLSDEELAFYLESTKAIDEQEVYLNPLQGFIPNVAQEALIRAVGEPGENKHIIYMMPAANSLGKTAAAISILGNIFWGPQNRWFDLPRFREWPKDWPKAAWYISEQSVLKDTVCGITELSDCEIRKWFPRGRYRFMKSDYAFYSELTTDTGWSLSAKTYDQEVKKFAGKKCSVVVFDEPPPEQIFNEVVARLMTGGIIIMPMTPLYTAAWTAERLTEPGRKDVWVLPSELCAIENNMRGKTERGFLDEDQIAAVIGNYDEDEKEARVLGKYMYLIGLVYKNVHADIHRHTMEPGDFDQEEWKILNVIDPHTAKPDLTGWLAQNRETGLVRVVGEFPGQPEFPPFHQIKATKLSTKDVAERIRAFEQDAGWDGALITRVMDPNFGNTKKGDTGMTTREYFRKIGKEIGYSLNYSCDVNDDLMAGHRLVREYLHAENPPDGGKPRAMLEIGMNCQNIWYAVTHYKFKKAGSEKAEADGPSEKVEQRVKDGNDIIRYGLMFLKNPGKKKPKEPEEEIPEHYGLYGHNTPHEESDWRDPYKVD